MGKLGEHGVLLVWKSLKQKFTIVSSTSVELIGVSDMFDLLQCARTRARGIYTSPTDDSVHCVSRQHQHYHHCVYGSFLVSHKAKNF